MKCNPVCRSTPVQDNTALKQEKVSRARIHRNQRKSVAYCMVVKPAAAPRWTVHDTDPQNRVGYLQTQDR
jgi:hypothetical protein